MVTLANRVALRQPNNAFLSTTSAEFPPAGLPNDWEMLRPMEG
jgi:hypothetical protein